MEQLKFIVELSGAAPQAQECEAISTSADTLPVAFLFKFVEVNSGNVSYKWTVSALRCTLITVMYSYLMIGTVL